MHVTKKWCVFFGKYMIRRTGLVFRSLVAPADQKNSIERTEDTVF